MNGLTKPQQRLLTYVRYCVKENGLPPTRREICKRFGWKSENAAQMHLKALERKGYVRLMLGKVSRGIQVTKEAANGKQRT